jgi:hypothetical protein
VSFTLYGAAGSGSVAVQAALTLLSLPYTTLEAPRMAEVVRRVDGEPRLQAFWAERFPFDAGWEGGGYA